MFENSTTFHGNGRYFIVIPIEYRDIDSYSVPRLIVYRGTCLTCVSWVAGLSWPTSLTWPA